MLREASSRLSFRSPALGRTPTICSCTCPNLSASCGISSLGLLDLQRAGRSMAEPAMAELAEPEILVSIDDALLDILSASGISFLVSSALFDKEGLTKCHAQAAEAFKRMVDDCKFVKRPRTFSHYVLDPVWPSAPFEALEDMILDDLICPGVQKDPDMLPVTVHHGRVVHGTLCAKPFVTGGVRTVFEDTQGRAVLLVIDNAVCTTASEADVCKKYPEGMKVAIKEPAFTHLWKDGTLGINVGNPADVVPTAATALADQANTHLNQGGDGWRLGLDCIKELHALANAHLADNECTMALNCYSSCGILLEDFKDIMKAAEDVKSCIPDTGEASTSTSGSADDRDPDLLRQEIQEMLKIINSERCETYLRLGSYRKALADVDMCLQLNPNCAKSKMQRAKCLHGIHLYGEEAACLEELLASLDISEPESDLLAEILHQKFRASIAMKQSLGIYELDEHEFSRLSDSELAPRCAPFVGPIELRTGRESGTAGRGQEPGVFASQDVKPGELLLVTNPLARGKAHWTWPRIRFYCRRPPRTSEEADHGYLTSWSARFQNTFVETIAKAQQSPQYAAQLMSMVRSSRTREPSLDLFTADWSDLDFGDVSSMEKHQRHLVNVNIRDIRYILATNGIVDGALYGLPSFFRHSCAPNCIRYTEPTQSGGAMFISSTCSIPAGEELSIHSVSIFHSNLLRSGEFARHFLQEFCTCPRCTFEDKALLHIPLLGDLLFRYNEEIETLGAFTMQKVEEMLTACSEVKDRLEGVLHSDDSAQLSGKEKDWIRCSFGLAFVFPVLSCSDSIAAGNVDEIVRVLTSVEPGTSSGLTILALCMHKMQFSDIERILREKYLDQDLYFPFKTANYENLLNLGRSHFSRFLSDQYSEVD